MALETGTRIGVYEVTGKLGEGGMGEVYRAHDTTLDRDVALKVLSEAFTAVKEIDNRHPQAATQLSSIRLSWTPDGRMTLDMILKVVGRQ